MKAIVFPFLKSDFHFFNDIFASWRLSSFVLILAFDVFNLFLLLSLNFNLIGCLKPLLVRLSKA